MADPSETAGATSATARSQGGQSTQGGQSMQSVERPGQGSPSSGVETRQRGGPLQTPRGDTTIEETVVQKLAGMATREVPGVHAMGNAARRAFSSMTERIPGSQTNVSNGVTVEKGERQAAIDVSIVVEYGYSVVEVSQGIRRNVIRSVENATGLEVLEVNVNVTDVHLPDENDDQEDQPDSRQSKSLE